MSTTLQLDVPAADAEFHDFAAAIAAGRLSDAVEPRNRLAMRGIELLWQPGRRAGGGKAPSAPRTLDRLPVDPVDEAWLEMRAAMGRGDYRGAARQRRALNALGFNILVRPESRQAITSASARRATQADEYQERGPVPLARYRPSKSTP
jgi:hypothetical protein